MHNYSINFYFFFQRKGLSWLPNLKKKENFLFFRSFFDDQGFASFYQTFCYKIFVGLFEIRSLSIVLILPPVKNGMCQMVYFCAKTIQLYSNFSGGGPPDPPPPQCSDTMLKKRNKEVQTKQSHYKWLLFNPITEPPPPLSLFFFLFLLFSCWNLWSEVRTPSGKIFWIRAWRLHLSVYTSVSCIPDFFSWIQPFNLPRIKYVCY